MKLAAEGAFGRRHLALRALVDRARGAQRPRQPLEARLRDVVIVRAIERLDMQRDAGIHREGVKPLLDQLGIEGADLVARELGAEHQEGAAQYVDRDAGEGLVHRRLGVGIAGDAPHVAERLLDRLAERDADVLGGVMVVDMQVALGLDRDVDARMARQEVEHMVEEADAGRDRRRAGAVEVDRDLDVGFLGGALDRAFAHGCDLWAAEWRAPCSRGWRGSPLSSPPPRAGEGRERSSPGGGKSTTTCASGFPPPPPPPPPGGGGGPPLALAPPRTKTARTTGGPTPQSPR